MLSLYLLLALVFGFVVQAAYKIIRNHRRLRQGCVQLLPRKTTEMSSVAGFSHIRPTAMKRISMEGFQELLNQSEDVLFVDMRMANRGAPLPFSPAQLLSISPSELADVFQWAPSGNTIVLYGEDDVCTAMVGQVKTIVPGTTMYLLNDRDDDLTAA